MLVDSTAPHDIADTLRIPEGTLAGGVDRVLARLRVEIPAPTASGDSVA